MSQENILWQPSEQRIRHSLMQEFMLQQKCKSYDELYAKSIASPSFWTEIAKFCHIVAEGEWNPVYQSGQEFFTGNWFADLKLNYAENLLANLAETPLIAHAENKPAEHFSKKQLINYVASFQNELKRRGIGEGDRVFAICLNSERAVAAMLATVSLGAIWASVSPDFGLQAIASRVKPIDPKLVFFDSEYIYGGKTFQIDSTISALKDQLPSQTSWICLKEISRATSSDLSFQRVGFSHPLFILFSSGTTGTPKCIVHGHGGTLLQHKKELMLHCDIKKNDRLLFFTTCGWMMWPWMVSALACGASIVTYDGSPGAPKRSQLFQTANDFDVTHLGTSPKYIAACHGDESNLPQNYRALRSVLTTGSPLLPAHFEWIYQYIATACEDGIHLASISGGTDIISCFVLGVPILPVFKGEIQRPGLGMAVESWNAARQRVRFQKGELVCTKPFPSMPVKFWNDKANARYRASYFEKFSPIWTHGDYIEETENGGFVIGGRSDATLNPGGVRIGTAEIYQVVQTFPNVLDSLAVGKKKQGDEVIYLFVKVKNGQFPDDTFIPRLKKHILRELSPRHVPARVIPVSDIPVTRSGKKMELLVHDLINGHTISNKESIANPESFEEIQQRFI